MNDGIKLYLDEDTISRSLVRALRARNIDVLTAQEAERKGVSDTDQLVYATAAGRVIFTFNTRDYVQLHAQFLAQRREHSGIIVSDQLQVGVILRRLLLLVDARSADEMRNWLEYLSNWR